MSPPPPCPDDFPAAGSTVLGNRAGAIHRGSGSVSDSSRLPRVKRPRQYFSNTSSRSTSSWSAMARRAALSAATAAALVAAQQDGTSAAPPACSPNVVELTVSTAAQLASLAQATNCSQGEVIVSWEGALVLSEPIVVGNSTSLSITGAGAGAALDGDGATRLFQVC